MKVAVAVLAAGRGVRFGADKVEATLGTNPVWKWSIDTFLKHSRVQKVFLVTAPEKVSRCSSMLGPDVAVIAGGENRKQSSECAVIAARDFDVLLIHDGARPFVTEDLISRVIDAIERTGAAAAAVAVTDTIKRVLPEGLTTLDRTSLVSMQTPQGARVELLLEAHRRSDESVTDDMAMLEAIGVHPTIVDGSVNNFKITTPEDLDRARAHIHSGETRTGLGYDVHPFSTDPSRPLMLGGVYFPDHAALDGHSDADVILHAATDALLGAAALGDIGEHFPNTDPQWKGRPSLHFLGHAAQLVHSVGWRIVNIDMTAIAESPKIMKRSMEIRSAIAESLGIEIDRVSIKATTNEGLGSIGRREGIAAFATATIQRQS